MPTVRWSAARALGRSTNRHRHINRLSNHAASWLQTHLSNSRLTRMYAC